MTSNILLSVDEMYQADAAAEAAGVPGLDLMEAAGRGVVDEICQRWQPCLAAVLCGPGNNGGDGFVVARLLAEAGWSVRLALLGPVDKLNGDAAINAKRYGGTIVPVDVGIVDGCDLVVDALFGAGLARPLRGVVADVVNVLNNRRIPCVSVDIPSGVDGNSGRIMGVALNACLTVTFFRRKPAHLLYPGAALAGDVVVVDIGIAKTVLADIKPQTCANGPELWLDDYPWPGFAANKYTRGHAVVVGGVDMTGAARLASLAARRIGGGLVSIAAAPEARAVYARGDAGTLFVSVADKAEFVAMLADTRKNAVLVGPGGGVCDTTKILALAALKAKKACVLDADALTVFQDDAQTLFDAIQAPCVLTPHQGEFVRLFDFAGDKLSSARAAAAKSGAVVLMKGCDTVIAAPDGRAVINCNAPPQLATAGSGDVLAGFIVGLLAQGMDAFDASCAAAWLHGAGAAEFGLGLIAEDIASTLPGVLKKLKAFSDVSDD